MNRYEQINEGYYDFKLTQMVNAGENVLWQGKPDKRCFILESIFNPFLPFAFIWFIIDSAFITGIVASGATSQDHSFLYIAIPFFALHLMPVWIYLAGVIFSFRKHRNTEFVITDKAIYISGGSISYECIRKAYEDISDIQIRQGFFDSILHVGDVIIERYTTGYGKHRHTTEHAIIDIYDYQNVYDLVIQTKEAARRRNQIQQETVSEPVSAEPKGYRNIDIE